MAITKDSSDSIGYNNKFLKHLNELGSRLELSEEVQQAAKNLVEPRFEKLRRHYDEKYLAASALIVTSRLEEEPRTIPQVCEVFQNKNGFMGQVNGTNHKSEVRKHFNKIKEVKDLNLKPVRHSDLVNGILKMAEDDIDRPEVREEAEVILEKVEDNVEFCDVSQTGLAASVIYLSCRKQPGVNISATNLEKPSGRNEKTIRSTAREIIEETDYEMEE
jgi:transcription initiation factor TFIIIB Brf1 subunit/transcription initiation factor TFIIB